VAANLPKGWVRKRGTDYYYRRAKEEGYRSRATYKLLQAVEKYGLIKPSDVVVDLGAAPGGWLQIAREIVGKNGFVLGVDINGIEPLGVPNVYTMVGDIRDPDMAKWIKALLPRPADVVVSDVSPHVSGVWELDHARQIELAECSLHIAISILKVEGHFFVKVFAGDMYEQFLGKVRRHFFSVKVMKPKASRTESAEIYALGLGFKNQ